MGYICNYRIRLDGFLNGTLIVFPWGRNRKRQSCFGYLRREVVNFTRWQSPDLFVSKRSLRHLQSCDLAGIKPRRNSAIKPLLHKQVGLELQPNLSKKKWSTPKDTQATWQGIDLVCIYSVNILIAGAKCVSKQKYKRERNNVESNRISDLLVVVFKLGILMP